MLFARPWHRHALQLTVQTHIPFADALRKLKRRLFGYSYDPSNISGALKWAGRVADLAQAHGRPVQGAVVLEIGSGWFPVLPMVLTAKGAGLVVMTDIEAHQDEGTTEAARKAVEARGETPALDRLKYVAPFEPGMLAESSVDMVVSRTVLEHIPPDDLSTLLTHLRGRMKPGGLHIHLVDNSDHWEHRDKSISRIEFLTRPAWLHKLLWWALDGGENRLRHSQYVELFRAAGYDILHAEPKVCPRTLADAKRLKLQEPFNRMPVEDLAAIQSVFVLRA